MIRTTEGKTMKKPMAITCLLLDIGGVLLFKERGFQF